MARLILWWSLIAVVIAASAMTRYDARQSRAQTLGAATLLPSVATLLQAQGHTIAAPIIDPERDAQDIGYRFSDGVCAGDMQVIAFPISFVGLSILEDFATPTSAHQFHYFDLAYTGSARVRTTAIWARTLIGHRLGLSDTAPSHLQLGVIWPADCTAPDVDWRAVWSDL